MTSSAMGRLRSRWVLAAILGLGGLCSGSAFGQTPPQTPAQPTRLIVQPGAEPGVFIVNGRLPDAQPPAAAPAVPPVVNAAPAATTPGAGVPCETSGAGCATGKSGRSHCSQFDFCQDNGPRVTCREVLAFHWCCCKAKATVPPPLGANVRTTNDMMRSNALGEYFVVYREDWLAGTTNLNESGERHFDGIVRRLGQTMAPVKVEPTGIAELDVLRKVALADALIRAGVPAPEAANRVVIGGTRAEGLRNGSIEALYSRGSTIYSGLGGGGGVGGIGGGGGVYFPAYAGVGR